MKAIVIGRHELTGAEGLEVLRQEGINFPAKSEGCLTILHNLLQEAVKEDCKLIFQAMPIQVAAAVAKIQSNGRIGGIVNTPGDRPTRASNTFYVDAPHDAVSIEEAVKFANPRAKTELAKGGGASAGGCKVVVDPPLRFKFSHIEWF